MEKLEEIFEMLGVSKQQNLYVGNMLTSDAKY